MSEYIAFNKIKEKPKTNIYSVYNKKSGMLLGYIKWHGAWRQYCFFPLGDSVFSRGCMKYINEFINKIMKKRK